MIDLTRNRRKIFAFTGLFVLLLAAVMLLLPPEISPALGGGVGLEYRIHAVFNDEEEQQLAESSLIQTASDTLGLPVEGSLVPSSAQENLWLLQLRLDPTDEIPYDDFQDLTYALINSFPGWTFQTTAGISQSRGTAVRSTVDYLLCLIVLLGMTGGVQVVGLFIDHLSAQAHELIDHSTHKLFVAGNRSCWSAAPSAPPRGGVRRQ